VAVALFGAITLMAAHVHGSAERSPFEEGLLTAIRAYERALALFGLGLALARQTVVPRWSSVAALTVGIAAGTAGEGNLANSALVGDPLFVLALPGPVACLIAGLALALPPILQKWLLPVFAAVVGCLIGIAIGLAAPAGSVFAFSAGGALAGLWIAVAPALLFQSAQRPWARILVRILGSWLIAIGLLLGGVRIIASKPPPPAFPPPATAEPLPPSAEPQAVPPPAAAAPFARGPGGELREQP
jgi:hydrogenase/urease accessory protein HupE